MDVSPAIYSRHAYLYSQIKDASFANSHLGKHWNTCIIADRCRYMASVRLSLSQSLSLCTWAHPAAQSLNSFPSPGSGIAFSNIPILLLFSSSLIKIFGEDCRYTWQQHLHSGFSNYALQEYITTFCNLWQQHSCWCGFPLILRAKRLVEDGFFVDSGIVIQ